MKNNKKIVWLLGILLLGVWGTILYQVYDHFYYEREPAGDENITVNDIHAASLNEQYVYEPTMRDPFRFTTDPEQKSVKKKEPAVPVPIWMPPPLKLTGILRNTNRQSALVEGSDGTAHFLHEGDTLAGMVILKIKDRTVMYKFHGKASEWVMEN